MANNSSSITPETLITIKVSLDDAVKKIKLPLKDLNSTTLPRKLRSCLQIAANDDVVLERYSDSAGGYITLNPTDVPVYKALIRAAKAKGKLRLKASIIPAEVQQEMEENSETIEQKSPVPARDSAALDQRSVGKGIFEYRQARASQQTSVEEAPVPAPFTAQVDKQREAIVQACQELAFRTRQPTTCAGMSHTAWSVYCNVCDKAMYDAHYHCSICDGGDYDLCETCVAQGQSCPGQDHWLIKRFIKDGKVVSSATERISRKLPETKMPGTFTEETKVLAEAPVEEIQEAPTRTCNNCVVVLPEQDFVTCSFCDDFDLCIACHGQNRHGHHPAHEFTEATPGTVLKQDLVKLLKAGRGIAHNAFCDGCDKKIMGIRHKCLQCPDWDYCSECISTAPTAHPRHRFAALFEPLPDSTQNYTRHIGIFCDGPLCTNSKDYIRGVRYKCAVCNDKDYCASCEALPTFHHNRTHPLIKFTTPVRNVSITTVNEDLKGNIRNMGDLPKNSATSVQTLADIAPSDEKTTKHAHPMDGDVSCAQARLFQEATPTCELNATFVRDTVPDGTVLQPGTRFVQVWTLRNAGPGVWPAGCSVRFIGGDSMRDVDNTHPGSLSSLHEASESSVIAREVKIGEEVAFCITLRAPTRVGKSISYWRVKAPDGTPFGNRLWCDIYVRSAKPPFAANVEIPGCPPAYIPRPPEAPMTSRYHPSALPASVQWQPNHTHQDQRFWNNNMNAAASEQQFKADKTTQQQQQQHQMMQLLQQQQILRNSSALRQQNARTAAPLPPSFQPVRPVGLSRATLPGAIEQDHARRENAKARMEAIRARIMQSRAEHVRSYPTVSEADEARGLAALHAEFLASHKAVKAAQVAKAKVQDATEEAKAVDVKAEKEELTTEVKEIEPLEYEDAKGKEQVNKSVSASSSQMIFPKLEKESPASSIIASSSKGKAAYVENEEGQVENVAEPHSPMTQTSLPVEADDLEDLDILSLDAESDDEDDEDDGFLTDEEYDILDASDRETVASP